MILRHAYALLFITRLSLSFLGLLSYSLQIIVGIFYNIVCSLDWHFCRILHRWYKWIDRYDNFIRFPVRDAECYPRIDHLKGLSRQHHEALIRWRMV